MTEQQKQAIIESGKQYFRSIIIPNHLKYLNKLHLSSFDINPFLINYLAAFLCGDTQPISLAKALVYPRILGTSLSTSFGQNVQVFIAQLQEVVGGASGIAGIDIEFVDIRKKMFKEILDNLGGRLRILVSAAAPIDPKVGKWVQDIGITFLQGYGLTETAPISALTPDYDARVGSAGKAVVCAELKIKDPNEKGEGEVLIKSSCANKQNATIEIQINTKVINPPNSECCLISFLINNFGISPNTSNF